MNAKQAFFQLINNRQMASGDPRVVKYLSMIDGKKPQEIRSVVENMARERGIDLNRFANQLGISLLPNI